ncbi:MAG: T9SS type A sorting domain-containing protein [Bacteroidetes bacterium]|nr:T9SS type A sorting domain-containing protein [Bacteroidota bacterium]
MTKSATRITPLQKLTTRGIQLLVLLLLILPFGQVNAQVTYNETFDVAGPYPNNVIPNGWSQGKFGAGVDADNYWDRMGNTAYLNGAAGQFVNPRTGTAMMRYRSDLTNAGEAAFLASKRLDMRGYSGTPTVSFWMYRDETTAGFNDNIRVYANFTPDMNGAPQQLTVTPINRPCGSAPIVACPVSYSAAGWQQYTYNIPAAFNTSSVYIVLLGTSALGANIFIDDFFVQTWPLAQNYVASSLNVINQNTASTAQSQVFQQIIGIRLEMDGVTAPRTLSQFIINSNGSTNPGGDILNARLYYTGGTNSFNLTTATLVGTNTNTASTNIAFLTPPVAGYTGLATMNNMEHGDNYFWVTYDIRPTATSGNFVDAELVSLTISGPGVVAPVVATLPGAREIDVVYCIPTMSVGTSWLNYVTNDYIANVTMAGNPTAPPGINNSLNSTGPNAGVCAGGACPFSVHPPDYELFPPVPGKTAALTADGTTNYPISLKVGTYCCSNYIAAWIDFNKNGSFLDPGEKIAQSGSLSNSQIYNTVFTVPALATTGTTRMRVREVWIAPNIDPCNSYTYGETEDYVVTILPTCGVPGWKTWLGFTDDWDNPANWCGGVPTINDNARLPGSGGTPYYRPVIKPGVFATAKKLRVETDDTLYIRSWSNSSLTVSDSMYIQGANSLVKVISTLIDTAQVSNGTLIPSATLTPLKNSTKAKSVWIFTQAELLAKGLVAGDNITDISLHINRLSNANPYRNLTLRYYYTAPATVLVPGVGAVLPTPIGAITTIYTADVFASVVIPGAHGTLTFNLNPGSFIWNGSTNKLVIELCYDNTGFGNTGVSDQPRYTQTLGFRHYGTLLNIAVINTPACDMRPSSTTTATAPIGSFNITVASAALLTPGQSVTGTGMPGGTVVVSILGNVVTLNNATTAALAATTLTFGSNVFWTPSDYRPNLTFKYDRPFSRYPIEVRGHWGNNGNFIPALSKVTLKGTAVQNVGGTSNTTFFDLGIDNNNHVVRQTDFTVTDTLMLTNGRLKLNLGQVNLTNPLIAALTRTNGFIQSEMDVIASNVAPFGRFHWDMGAAPGLRVIPFIKATGAYIPLDYNIDSGTHDVVLATHATLANNTNIPPSITNINGYFTGTDNSNSMVDRFYMVDNTAGTTPQADITFRYAVSERAALGNASIKAQRWLSPTTEWEYPFIPTQAYVTDVVTVTDFTAFNSNVWWALVNESSPLPVELLDFTAKPENDKVKLTWVTASEINSSHYVVERTVDQSSFDYISRVESRGPSSSTLEYYTWDNSPLDGKQFYYLRQHDYDGKVRTYGPVAVEFSKDVFDIITATTTSSELGVTVVFNYNSNEPYKYSIVDMTGRTIVTKDNNPAEPGANVIDIEADLSKGVYQIVLQNSNKVVTKKFFY